ncbi:hypothetical protein AAFM79_02545 [Trichormus azollae HNT15244]
MFLEDLENDIGGHCIPIKDDISGTGTRIAANKIRTIVVNVINTSAL